MWSSSRRLFVNLSPVAAAARNGVGHIFAVGAEADAAQCHRAIITQLVGVEHKARLAHERVLHIQHTLVLQPGVTERVILAIALERNAHLLVIEQLRHTLLQCTSKWNTLQVGISDSILGLYPCLGGSRSVVFEPTIRIGDTSTEVFINNSRVLHCLGIIDFARTAGAARSQNNRTHCNINDWFHIKSYFCNI